MAEKQIIPAIVGLSGGFVIAGGVIALMVGLGIITRFVGITHTAKHVKGYETAILAGAIFGNLLTVHQIRIPLGIFGLVLMGVLFGIFVGGCAPAGIGRQGAFDSKSGNGCVPGRRQASI